MKDTIKNIADKFNIDFDTAKAIYLQWFKHCYTRKDILTKQGLDNLIDDIIQA